MYALVMYFNVDHLFYYYLFIPLICILLYIYIYIYFFFSYGPLSEIKDYYYYYYYIAKVTENISVTVLSFCANYIKQAAHLCFGNNVTCYMSAISKIA